MYSVTVSKAQLLETLQANLTKHVAEYEEARANYPAAVVEALRERADEIEVGTRKPYDYSVNLPRPHSYADEYEDAIQMLEWSTEETVELDQSQFKQYVQDEWNWKAGFTTTTSMYNSR